MSGVNTIGEAAEAGDLERVAEFLQSNPDLVFSMNDTGRTPLHMAAYEGHWQVARLLLAGGALVNAISADGWMPLHTAAAFGHIEFARLLLSNDAEVNSRVNNGKAPLHWAAGNGHTEMVKLLLAAGADVDMKDHTDEDGRTPLDLAVIKGFGEIAVVLRNQARSEWSPGSNVLKDFVVERILGEGGMGMVYLVRSLSSRTLFAVKRTKGLKAGDRANFLAELQTWIDLPEHPNLVPCRFFRTLGGEVLIFADYVEGGSLKEWIGSRRLYGGDDWHALQRILDISIQFAWALHCLHRRGLIHQDVKPANVLMSTYDRPADCQMRPRITDFGLARARAAAGERFSRSKSGTFQVSSGGGTPAYWSPEQADRRPLTRKTDIWSWGLSILEMFMGEVSWLSGQGAADVLDAYSTPADDCIPVMPTALTELLRTCFRLDPDQRPANLADIVDRLKVIYRDALGGDYSGALEAMEPMPAVGGGIKQRYDPRGTDWTDSKVWLEKALAAAGRDPAQAAAIAARVGVTRRGELVAEISVYQEAKEIFQQLVWGGHKNCETDLIELCGQKASVHEAAADFSGAIQEQDEAIAISERLVSRQGHDNLRDVLATLYLNKGNLVGELGDHRGALALYDQAITIREGLASQEGRPELWNKLATLYVNKAGMLVHLGDVRGAVSLYDRAIAIRDQLAELKDRALLGHLATAYASKANAVAHLGDQRGAMALHDRAIAIWENLVNLDDRREWAADLATVYMNKANTCQQLGDAHGALRIYDQSIAIRERLVNQEGRRELADDLAAVYVNKAAAFRDLGDKRSAVALCDQAIAIRERLVLSEDRRDRANGLAMVYVVKAIVISSLGDDIGALKLYDRAIVIWERLVHREGRREFAGELAWTKANRGRALMALGEREHGIRELRSARTMLEWAINVTGRSDLKQAVTWVDRELSRDSE